MLNNFYHFLNHNGYGVGFGVGICVGDGVGDDVGDDVGDGVFILFDINGTK